MTIYDSAYNMPTGSDEAWQQYDAANDDKRLSQYDALYTLKVTNDALDALDMATTEDDEALVAEARAALVEAVEVVERLLYTIKNRED